MKKRILAVIVASLLIVSMTVPVMAAGSGNSNKAMEILIMKMLFGIKDEPKSEESSSSSSSSSNAGTAAASSWTNGAQNTDLNANTMLSYVYYNAVFNTGLTVAAAQWGNKGDQYWSFKNPLFVPGSNVVIQEFWTTGESKSTNVKADANNTASKKKAVNAAGSVADTAAACLKVGNQ